MLALLLALAAAQEAAETTPSLDSLSISTNQTGTCFAGTVETSAAIQVDWTATNFNPATHQYKVYRDGVLVSTQGTEGYGLELSGLVENDPHLAQTIDFNYSVQIERTSDSAVLASREESETKSYGVCDGPVL